MKCEHKQIVLQPENIKKHNEGVMIRDLSKGKAFCRACNQEIPFEDVYLYDNKDIFVGIPTSMVDGDDNE